MQDVAMLPNLKGVLESIPAPWDQLPDLGLYMDQVITYVERQFSPMPVSYTHLDVYKRQLRR